MAAMGPHTSHACWRAGGIDKVALSFMPCCDKSCPMIWIRLAVLVLALAVEAGCTGGGGGSSSPPAVPWEKFRQDLGNNGQAVAGVIKNPGSTPTPDAILWAKTIDPPGSTPSMISASPAIDLNSILYIGSEGGTLAALNLSDGSSAWPSSVRSCSACTILPPSCAPTGDGLGRLTSSPAVYITNNMTNVFVGSEDGSVYAFQFSGNNAPNCLFCFRPTCYEPLMSASFVSSPSFTINSATTNVAGVFIGATLTDL